MGLRGPPPKPHEIRELEGNPANRPIPKQGPKPERAPPGWAPPSHLHGEARREWFRLVKMLRAVNVLAVTDRMVLATCCLLWGRIVEAELWLRRQGRVLTTTNGNLVHNPWLSISKQSIDQHKAYLIELGLTPSARARMAAAMSNEPPPPTPASETPENDTPEAEAIGAGTQFGGLLGKQRQH